MESIMRKHLSDILSRINEDDESYLKFTKELGKITYCLHKYYPNTFTNMKS